jgi:hypothetical protein
MWFDGAHENHKSTCSTLCHRNVTCEFTPGFLRVRVA